MPPVAGLGHGVGSTRTVERALDLLAEVCAEGELSLAECARRTGLPPSTALRLLRTLDATGFVTRAPAGDFAAGPRLVQLAAQAMSRTSLVRVSRPALDRLVASSGESAYLSIAGPNASAVYVAVVEGTHTIRHTSWAGRSVPQAGLAVGEVLQGRTPTDGYVAQRDAHEPDVTAIAAPVHGPAGDVVGALSLLGPTYRITEVTMHRYGADLARETRRLSELLGAGTTEETAT